MVRYWVNFYLNTRRDYWGCLHADKMVAIKVGTDRYATLDSRLAKSDLFKALGYEE